MKNYINPFLLALGLALASCSLITQNPDGQPDLQKYITLSGNISGIVCRTYVNKALQDSEVADLKKSLVYTSQLLTSGVDATALVKDLEQAGDVAAFAPLIGAAISIAQTEVPEQYKEFFITKLAAEIVTECEKGLMVQTAKIDINALADPTVQAIMAPKVIVEGSK